MLSLDNINKKTTREMKSHQEMDYRGYKYVDKVPLITCCDQMRQYLDSKFEGIDVDIDVDMNEIRETVQNAIEDEHIQETIEETLNHNLDCKFCQVNCHIDHAEQHIRCELNSAKNEIIEHIDDALETINFEEKFDNLNEQVNNILERL